MSAVAQSASLASARSAFSGSRKALNSTKTVRAARSVAAKAEVKGEPVSLGTALAAPLADLRRVLSQGGGYQLDSAPVRQRVKVGGARRETGAKFIKP